MNLADGAADWLPQGVALEQARRDGRSWVLRFSGELRDGRPIPQLFDQDYYDEQGKRYEVHEWSFGYNEQGFYDEFVLIDYPYDVVYLSPSFSRVTTQDVPVEIEVE